MQFMIVAYDGTDSEAPARRRAARAAHLQRAETARGDGHLIAGGAILDPAGDMIGSTLYVEFQSREQLDHWLREDPYVTKGVWTDIAINPIRLAIQP